MIHRNRALTSLASQVHETLELPWSDGAQGDLARLLPDGGDLHARLSEALAAGLGRRLQALQRPRFRASVRERATLLAGEHRWE